VIHLFSLDIPTPRSSATCFRVSPLVSAIRTASCRNSSVRFSPIVSLLCYNKCYQRSGITPRQIHTGLGRSRARKYLEKPLLQLKIKKDNGSERVKVFKES
jgi:hypothetical protein